MIALGKTLGIIGYVPSNQKENVFLTNEAKKRIVLLTCNIATAALIALSFKAALPLGALAITSVCVTSFALSVPSALMATSFLIINLVIPSLLTAVNAGMIVGKYGVVKATDFASVYVITVLALGAMGTLIPAIALGTEPEFGIGLLDDYVFRPLAHHLVGN